LRTSLTVPSPKPTSGWLWATSAAFDASSASRKFDVFDVDVLQVEGWKIWAHRAVSALGDPGAPPPVGAQKGALRAAAARAAAAIGMMGRRKRTCATTTAARTSPAVASRDPVRKIAMAMNVPR